MCSFNLLQILNLPNVWCATANANDCKSTSTATKYADEALKAFDERFPKPKEIIVELPKENVD